MARDRRNAGNHEAAHYTIGCFIDVPIGAWIKQIGDGSTLRECSFVGQCVFPADALRRVSQRGRMMLGIAGLIGEAIWRCRTIDVQDLLDADPMSSTDCDIAGISKGEYPRKLIRAGERVADLLSRELRQEWLLAARTLIRTGILVPADNPAMAEAIARHRDRAS